MNIARLSKVTGLTLLLWMFFAHAAFAAPTSITLTQDGVSATLSGNYTVVGPNDVWDMTIKVSATNDTITNHWISGMGFKIGNTINGVTRVSEPSLFTGGSIALNSQPGGGGGNGFFADYDSNTSAGSRLLTGPGTLVDPYVWEYIVSVPSGQEASLWSIHFQYEKTNHNFTYFSQNGTPTIERTPEPATLALLASGLVTLGIALRRKV